MENQLIRTSDGSSSVMSLHFGVSYHSVHGAIQESQTVFIEAGLAKLAEQGKKKIRILELGLGTGLNALLTAIYAQAHGLEISYTCYELYPLAQELLGQLNYLDELGQSDMGSFFEALHQGAGQRELLPFFALDYRQADFLELDEEEAFNLIYFDAFAPSAQPELWEEQFLQKLYRALDLGGLLTTYCAKGAFKRSLKALGFALESLPGPPGKREMTRAQKI